MIAGTSSGCGKTTIMCGILQLLKENGKCAVAFKCGPDYIDPMFSSFVTGEKTANLDSFFLPEEKIKKLLFCHSRGKDISVIEGAMGYYDGTGADGLTASSYDIARITNTPVVLIVQAKGASSSVLASIKGFLEFMPDSRICGVILNQTRKSNYEHIKMLAKKHLNHKIKFIGYVPVLPMEYLLESRHLGLVTAKEIDNLNEKIRGLATFLKPCIDVDMICDMAENAYVIKNENIGGNEDVYCKTNEACKTNKTNVTKIAVAKDEAFCFLYGDNEEILQSLGSKLVYFSPLKDEPIPEGACGLILPGGYPENYLDILEGNEKCAASIRKAIENGMPCIAECGGFMYLSHMVEGRKMIGILDGDLTNKGKLVRFGYVTIKAKNDTLLLSRGEEIKGHEFHYFDSNDNGNAYVAKKESGKEWDCVVATDTLYAGFPHLYLPSNINAAKKFVRRCKEYDSKTNGH